jgi:hypothetical protein
MGQVMYLGGRKVLTAEEVEARRQGLLQTLGRVKGDLADAEQQVVSLTVQAHRLEGGIIEAEWTLEQMALAEPVEEES